MDAPPFFKHGLCAWNMEQSKNRFLLCELKKPKDGLFQQPIGILINFTL
jgi:hypothetical protein